MSLARICKSASGRSWESFLSLLRMRWDHEPDQADRGAGVPPSLRRSQRQPSVLLALARSPGRRDACPTLRFMERSWILRMYPACWLLTLALVTPRLQADDPAAISPGSQRSEPRTLPSQSSQSPDGNTANESAPAVPKPSIGRTELLPPVFAKATPSSLADLASIEKHVKTLVTRVSPAVVAVQVGGATGSGVVVSADGLVLTVAHVCERPNREVRFFFPDGKTARGKTLGMNHEIDSGLMKITDDGTWPHVEIGEIDRTRSGDWALALGHPGGFDAQRPVVARLGRVITLAPGAVRTDCTLMGGDSGGPLFDMHGRVIAIHSRISDSTADNFHVPIKTYSETWERLAKGESWGDERPPSRPWVGARGVDDPEGCRLERVDENGPAFKAGLKVGDIVVKVNGQEIKDSDSFFERVTEAKPGDEVTFEIKRDDKEISVKVTVEARRRRW